jgi:hypothetical protein
LNWYNEIDPQKAAWLRELIRRGLIAPGEVDERSTRGYVAGNVTSCCSECNYAKGDLTPEEFLELVRRIYRWSCAE